MVRLGCYGLCEWKLAATAFQSEGGCEEKQECGAGDLWPRGRLISAVTSPDVRLAVSSSLPIAVAHTHICNHTAQNKATHAARQRSVPRPFLTVPQSCCMLSCSRQTAVFSALPFFAVHR